MLRTIVGYELRRTPKLNKYYVVMVYADGGYSRVWPSNDPETPSRLRYSWDRKFPDLLVTELQRAYDRGKATHRNVEEMSAGELMNLLMKMGKRLDTLEIPRDEVDAAYKSIRKSVAILIKARQYGRGYQPTNSDLDSSNPPKGGSGVPKKEVTK